MMNFLKNFGILTKKRDYEQIKESDNKSIDLVPLLEEIISNSCFRELEFNPNLARKDCLARIIEVIFLKSWMQKYISEVTGCLFCSQKNFLGFCVESGNNKVLEKFLGMICSDELLAFVDDYNQTPLHIAISTGNYKAVCLLCERCNDDLIEIRNGNNENVLELAGQKAILEIFLVVYERFGDFEVYDILKRNFNGMLDLVLHEFFDAIHLKDFVTVCKMLDVHPRLKYQLDHKGWNALHEAAANGLNDMVQLLLEYNKDYNEYLPYRQTKTRDCKNALHLAVERCQVGCVKVLIEGCRNRIFYMKDINDITVDDLIHSLQKEDPKCEIAELITSRQAELGDAKVYFDPDAVSSMPLMCIIWQI
eukprot:TRINITY_DN60210_c0_g2_i2.p1 TRINITY_DN60210_c0_g2~~TRINITY_DN60210_c0_g2_i2.p1  ORF type:complete len:364 (-),score=55.83 TRINITY_DN60210_c0_g2_i2:23-1114(-)